MLTKTNDELSLKLNNQAIKVLVADDDLPTRMLLRAAMNQWGYEVIEANDGEEAWEILKKDSPPMLLVVDWLMPKLDGIELSKRIKKELNFHPYIILLTQVTGTANIVKALEAGADEFLTKPFNMAELRSRLLVGAKILGYKHIMEEQTQQLKEMKARSIDSENYVGENKEFDNNIKALLKMSRDFLDDVSLILPEIIKLGNEKGELYIAHAKKIQGTLKKLNEIVDKVDELYSEFENNSK